MGDKAKKDTKPAKKKNYGAGGKRKEIRKYVTSQGVRVPVGNASLSVDPNLIGKSVKATLKVPIKRSTLSVGGSVSPEKKSVGVKLKIPLGGKKKR